MNIENIDLAISMLYRIEKEYPPQTFNMNNFQSYNDDFTGKLIYEENPDAIKECGTTCCFSGWLNIAKEFKDYPNKEYNNYQFRLSDDWDTIDSVAELLGISLELADVIIYPSYDKKRWNDIWGKYGYTVEDIYKFEDGKLCDEGFDWSQIKPEHLVDVLGRIKSGELQ